MKKFQILHFVWRKTRLLFKLSLLFENNENLYFKLLIVLMPLTLFAEKYVFNQSYK